jgi:phospholipid transport system substrate-binding protein
MNQLYAVCRIGMSAAGDLPSPARRRLLMTIAAVAAGGQAAGIPRHSLAAETSTGPEQTVQTLTAGLSQVMQAGKATPFNWRYQTLAPIVDGTFDLGAVLRASVGPSWAALPQEDHVQLLNVFRQYTIASLVANFNKYDGASSVSGGRPLPNGEVVVGSKLGGTDLSFVLHSAGGVWRVVDVLADGTISRVAVQRSDFRALLRQGGGQALLGSLQRKITELSNGTEA